MRIFKNKSFAKFAKDEKISDTSLVRAVFDAGNGLIDADLGGGVIKQRIARPNEGKSKGYRSIILFRAGERAFFVYGFPKSGRDNIDNKEENAFKKLAKNILSLSDGDLNALLEHGVFQEVTEDGKKRDI